MGKIKAVILIGGPGMRLRPLTADRPKSVVPVLNRPALEHTLAYLKRFGIDEIVLTLSYQPGVIAAHFGDGSRFGLRLTYCIEKEPLGTAGAVKNAENYLDGTFLVLNGDIFTDLDLADMLACHRKNKAGATLSLTWVEDPSAFGVVETDGAQRVRSFIEKPPLAEATSHWINAGVYMLEPEVLNYIPPDTHYMFERGLFPGLLEAGEAVYGYPYRGFWLDMGTPASYFSLNMGLLAGRVQNRPVSACAALIQTWPGAAPPVLFDSGCMIDKDAAIMGPAVIGRDCCLEQGASVENSILWDNVTLRAGASVKNCIIGNNVVIEGKSVVADSIVTALTTAPLKR